MMRSKRIHTIAYTSFPAFAWNQSNNHSTSLKSSGRGFSMPTGCNSDELLHLCISHMIPHNWYRVLPVNCEDYDGIAFSIGQSWELLYPLPIELVYIYEVLGVANFNLLKLPNLPFIYRGN